MKDVSNSSFNGSFLLTSLTVHSVYIFELLTTYFYEKQNPFIFIFAKRFWRLSFQKILFVYLKKITWSFFHKMNNWTFRDYYRLDTIIKYFFIAEVLTSNYLIPYEEGGNGCKSKTNCLFCTSDAKCAWCSDTHTCHDKSKNDSLCLHSNPKLRPNQCSSCTNFIHCSDCVSAESDGACEWLANDARVST